MGTFQVITASDIEQAAEKVSMYLGSAKADTIILDMHGITYTGKDRRELWLSPDISNKDATGALEIDNFLNVDKTKNSNSENQNNDVKALKDIFSNTKEGGKFVFMACNIADDRKLMSRLVDLSENRIRLYMNADNTPSIISRGKVQLWTGRSPLSRVKS